MRMRVLPPLVGHMKSEVLPLFLFLCYFLGEILDCIVVNSC